MKIPKKGAKKHKNGDPSQLAETFKRSIMIG